MNEVNSAQDIIDSRDVIARIEELRGEISELTDQMADDPEAADTSTIEREIESVRVELEPLESLANEAEGYAPDWHHGEALIRDSYFEEYARQLADDIGALPYANNWPLTCIDWEQAASELQMDYTAVEFDGVTYWIR